MRKNFVTSLLTFALLAASLVPTTLAGIISGSVAGSYRISSYSSRTFTATFRGGEWARVGVRGDGDTDLDLYVYDENGELIEMDEDDTDRCLVEWVPRRTSTFTIRVVNRGPVYNNCVIATN